MIHLEWILLAILATSVFAIDRKLSYYIKRMEALEKSVWEWGDIIREDRCHRIELESDWKKLLDELVKKENESNPL